MVARERHPDVPYDAFISATASTQNALAISRDGKHYWRVKRARLSYRTATVASGQVGTDPRRRSASGTNLAMAFGHARGQLCRPDRMIPAGQSHAASPDDNKIHRELRPWKVGLAVASGWLGVCATRARESGI